jgi:hypothetical protein
VLRDLGPQRTASSISGSAFVDGRYFARQIYLPMIEACLTEVASTSPEALAVLAPNLVASIEECQHIVAAGGVEAVKRGVEALAEEAGERLRLGVVERRTREALEANDGAELTAKQRKIVRDSGSSSKSNEKRKQLYGITRDRLQQVLVLRANVFDALYELFYESAKPNLDADEQFLPTKTA